MKKISPIKVEDKSYFQFHEDANKELLSLISPEEMDRVLNQKQMCDIDPRFLGFVGTYKFLSLMIPKHFTVIDFGCAYSPQCYFFSSHNKYIGIDLFDNEKFKTENTTHFVGTISDWIEVNIKDIDIDTTFAICNYVPNWHDKNIEIVNKNFKNVYSYYPG